MVHDDDQAGAAVGEAGDERGRPQRPGPGQGFAGHGRGHLQQCPLIAGRRAGPLPDVVPQVKRGVVGPERPAAAGRRPAQPLPEPGHGADPLTEQPLCFHNAEAWPGAKGQHGADMHGRGSHVRGELHQVGRAGPVHRHPRRHACAHVAPPSDRAPRCGLPATPDKTRAATGGSSRSRATARGHAEREPCTAEAARPRAAVLGLEPNLKRYFVALPLDLPAGDTKDQPGEVPAVVGRVLRPRVPGRSSPGHCPSGVRISGLGGLAWASWREKSGRTPLSPVPRNADAESQRGGLCGFACCLPGFSGPSSRSPAAGLRAANQASPAAARGTESERDHRGSQPGSRPAVIQRSAIVNRSGRPFGHRQALPGRRPLC